MSCSIRCAPGCATMRRTGRGSGIAAAARGATADGDTLASEVSGKHLLLPQEKLNTYLRFVESGEVYSAYPAALGKRIEIHVYWRIAPTSEAEQFLSRVTSIVGEAELGFSHGPAGALN